ncbi:MAG: hypothetical protein AAFY60_19740, partial [Myxococcota bacterium]
ATDLEVYLALQSLISNEIIRVMEVEVEEGAAPLLSRDPPGRRLLNSTGAGRESRQLPGAAPPERRPAAPGV